MPDSATTDLSESASPPFAATILVIDDVHENLLLANRLLSRAGYHCIIADNGKQGLEIASNIPQPDLILLDIMMPGMDGFEVLSLLKSQPYTAHIPVIFLSALDDHKSQEEGLLAGAVDYINKPIVKGILLARIKAQLELKQYRDQLENQNAWLAQEVDKRLAESRSLEAQLLQAEKLASIGQLAAGVAHELNNPIGFVSSNLGTLDGYARDLLDIVQELKNATEHPEHANLLEQANTLCEQRDLDYIRKDIFDLLHESRDGLDRVSKIIQDLKAFSRVGEKDWQPANLHQGLDSTLNIVWNELKYKCTVTKDYGDLPLVTCLMSQLNQVFMNLLVNASQAIEKRGTITIRTRKIDNNHVRIEIEDTGKGIAPEDAHHIFEPFFTTKPVGKGTGLGLSVSYGIVQKHHGTLDFTSTPGEGTCFRITLPIEQENSSDGDTHNSPPTT